VSESKNSSIERGSNPSTGEGASAAPIDVEAIMARIRKDVVETLESSETRFPRYMPKDPQNSDGKLQPVQYSDELSYLNAHWNDWAVEQEFVSHRKFFGRIIVSLKSRFRNFLWQSLFKEYFERERTFQANLIRYLNANARYIDSRDSELFWQIIQKLDNDIALLNDRGDRLYDHCISALNSVERKYNSVS
jgi:hypothetical protein